MQRHGREHEDGTTRRRFLEVSAAVLTGAVPTIARAGDSLQTTVGARGSQGSPDLANLTIADAARRLSKKQLSPVELTEALLARIARLNPSVGAFITVTADQAMTSARAAERDIQGGRYRGPLHGIPFGVKDTYYTKGILTTAGSPVLRDFRPTHDAAIVERLVAAGGVLVGKLNLPEFSFGGVTPDCNNPWDLTRNAGGSSGGPAAALAASMLMAAGGGDTSGSIRNPASTCGVVGLKPTFGLVSRYGVVPISWTLDHLGPMANTVEDTAILLQVMAGHDSRDHFSASYRPPDYRTLLRRSLRGLRIGVIAPSEIEAFHTDTKRAFADAVGIVKSLGADIREITFPARMRTAGAAQGIIRICEAAAYHRQYLLSDAVGRYLPDGTGANRGTGAVRTTIEAGSLLTAAQYLQAQRARTSFIDDMRAVHAPVDAILSPTMPSPAGVPTRAQETFRSWWNLCGFPAVSLPCGFSTDPPGLPIGLQISGRPFDDGLILGIAHAYERATEWHTRRPLL
jgi:aspartyl-tRNA(Asn)/glutamyl-tRNA(Gln) amidotransferase subunit A